MMDDADRSRIREFLSWFVAVDDLADSDDIFSAGIVNSLFAMQLVAFVESEYEISVENEDLDIRNFSSVDAICDFVYRKSAE